MVLTKYPTEDAVHAYLDEPTPGTPPIPRKVATEAG